jgi:transposase
MPKTRPPYAPEFRRQVIELVRAGRDPTDLAREFEPSSQAIRNWVAQADREEGRREARPPATEAALPSAEREELARLRRENKQLRLERGSGTEVGVAGPRRLPHCLGVLCRGRCGSWRWRSGRSGLRRDNRMARPSGSRSRQLTGIWPHRVRTASVFG